MKRRNIIPRAPSTHSYDNYNHLNDRVVHIPHFNAIKETKIEIYTSKSMDGVFLDKKRIYDTLGIL